MVLKHTVMVMLRRVAVVSTPLFNAVICPGRHDTFFNICVVENWLDEHFAHLCTLDEEVWHLFLLLEELLVDSCRWLTRLRLRFAINFANLVQKTLLIHDLIPYDRYQSLLVLCYATFFIKACLRGRNMLQAACSSYLRFIELLLRSLGLHQSGWVLLIEVALITFAGRLLEWVQWVR